MWMAWIVLVVGIIVGTGSFYVQTKLQRDFDGLIDPVVLNLPDLPVWPKPSSSTSSPATATATAFHNLTNKIELIGSNELVGPETLVVVESSSSSKEKKKYMFMGLGDGRIVRLTHSTDANGTHQPEWTYLVRTSEQYPVDDPYCNGIFSPSDVEEKEWECGRPLGMIVVKRSTVDPDFPVKETTTTTTTTNIDDEDVLIVTDAYRGLLMITNIYDDDVTRVEVVTLAIGAEDDDDEYTFRLLNAVVQDPSDGSLYITETSRTFQRRRIFYAAFDGRPDGRLLKYTVRTESATENGEDGGVGTRRGTVHAVAENLYMPNGITMSLSTTELLVVCGVTIQRYSLVKQRMLPSDANPFVRALPGTGDNIRAMTHTPSGAVTNCYWVGLGSKFAQPFSLLKFTSDKPWLKSILIALIPYATIVELIPKLSALAIYDTDGELIELYQDEDSFYPWISEGELFDNYLYLGSWYNTGLARAKMD